MSTFLLIFGCIFFIIGCICAGYAARVFPEFVFLAVISSFVGIGLLVGSSEVYKANQIKAIDVYRGNTELKVTYTVIGNDTISCDSTVVFKDYHYCDEGHHNK